MSGLLTFAVHKNGDIDLLSTEQHLRLMGVSAPMSAAYDILQDDGADMETMVPLLDAAERSGRDVEAFARHLVKLRKAYRSVPAPASPS